MDRVYGGMGWSESENESKQVGGGCFLIRQQQTDRFGKTVRYDSLAPHSSRRYSVIMTVAVDEVASKSEPAKVTVRTLRKWVRADQKIPMLTCYDATTAAWLWRGGVRCMLVGDTAAQMMLGYDSTLPVPLSFMLHITAAVRRGAPDAFVMADMPFGSYQANEDRAVANAMRFIKTASADVVKLEVDSSFAPLVERLTRAGVPVVAHLGSRPQQVRAEGGYRAVGRTRTEAAELIDTAELMIQRGAAMLLLEAVPAEVSQMVVDLAERTSGRSEPVPVIGCGGGPACHGHIVVLHDLLGLSDWQPPFARPVSDLGQQIAATAAKWAELVESGRYLLDDHPYKMK